MCQNDTRAMVIVYLPPKSARSALQAIPKKTILSPFVLQRTTHNFKNAASNGWLSVALTHTYTPALIRAVHEKHRSVFYCFEFGAAWSASGRSQPLLSIFCCCIESTNIFGLSLFVTYTYIKENAIDI